MEEARENTILFNSIAERTEYMKEHDSYYNVMDEYYLIKKNNPRPGVI